MSIEVYQNYLNYIPDDVYKTLIDNNILDGLKFPGNKGDAISNQKFVDLVKELGCSVDNHGFSGITGRLHDSRLFRDDFEFSKTLKNYLQLPGAGSIYSGHLGMLRTQSTLFKDKLDDTLKNNVKAIRNLMGILNPNEEIKVYGEGVFPKYCTLETSTPEFLNKCVSLEGGVDGLVLDLCHSAITAAYLYEKNDSEYNFNRFLDELKCDKVGIIHLSGGYVNPINCGNFRNDDVIDPHMPCNLDDFSRLFIALERCNNVFRLSNEIAFVCLDRNIDVSVKAYLIEALLTRIAVEKRNMAVLCDARDYLFSASFENHDEVVKSVKRRYLEK